MKTFTVKFTACNVDLGVIVTPLNGDNQKFKVEMTTGEPDPAILTRSGKGSWIIENPGKWTFSETEFQEIGYSIDAYLNKIYAMKTILVLVDFSETSFNAARYATALAQQLETTRIILYHSCRYVPVPEYIPISTPSETQNINKESIEHLTSLKGRLQSLDGKQMDIEIRTDERKLVSAVQLISEQQHVGLVVMGITGKGELEQMLVGSNAITVSNECFVPLLIVPENAKFENVNRVLFACDLKKVLTGTHIHTIKTFIHALNAKLSILNVNNNEPSTPEETIVEQFSKHGLWESENPDIHSVDDKDIAEGVMRFADENDLKLVIIVPEKYGFFESFLHRNITEKIAFHTHIPLLLMRENI